MQIISKKVFCILGIALIALTTVMASFRFGKFSAKRDYYLLNSPSHLILLLDLRGEMEQIPEEVRRQYGVRIDKYDVIICYLVNIMQQNMEATEKAYLKHTHSKASLEHLRREIKLAEEIARSTNVTTVDADKNPFKAQE